jgi:hypothetical protein
MPLHSILTALAMLTLPADEVRPEGPFAQRGYCSERLGGQ